MVINHYNSYEPINTGATQLEGERLTTGAGELDWICHVLGRSYLTNTDLFGSYSNFEPNEFSLF